MIKIALLDFCGTVANFQTFDPYLEYALRCENPARWKRICHPAIKGTLRQMTRLCKVFGVRHYFYKHLLVRQLKGVPYTRLKQYGTSYYRERVRGNLIPQTMELLQRLKADGYWLVIVSAGSALYIKDFAQEFGIDHIVTATLGFDGESKCTGKLLSECMGAEKLQALQKLAAKLPSPKEWSVACSDSRSDMALFRLCKRKIVISHKKHQKWVREGMEEIIWQ